ncbi:MAG TPA: siphovirus Gp157 family protein [Bryobacteraceae bacterium]|nr:siphovirus Gp157 family protein [Bryobacteraceae bacterium]
MKDLAPLWKISEDLDALVNSAETCPPELEAELQSRIASYLKDEVAKVDRVGEVFASLDDMAENARREIGRLRAREQSAERTKEQLAKYVLRVLREREGRPLKGHNVTFSVRHSEALIVDDPERVPFEWKRQTVSVDIPKDPLKRALKAGSSIPGVHLEQRENLQRK